MEEAFQELSACSSRLLKANEKVFHKDGETQQKLQTQTVCGAHEMDIQIKVEKD